MRCFFWFLTILAAGSQLAAAEFWNTKIPAGWSDGETREFLTKSPWVHYLAEIRVPSDAAPFHLVPAGTVAIRWESALLMRDALAQIESPEYKEALANFARDYYIIAVIRIREGQNKAEHLGFFGHWSRELMAESAKTGTAGQRGGLSQSMGLMDNSAREVLTHSWLLWPGHLISPERVESGNNTEGGVDLVMFPRSLGLESGDGDIDFKTTLALGMGRTSVSMKFSLKKLMGGSERGL